MHQTSLFPQTSRSQWTLHPYQVRNRFTAMCGCCQLLFAVAVWKSTVSYGVKQSRVNVQSTTAAAVTLLLKTYIHELQIAVATRRRLRQISVSSQFSLGVVCVRLLKWMTILLQMLLLMILKITIVFKIIKWIVLTKIKRNHF